MSRNVQTHLISDPKIFTISLNAIFLIANLLHRVQEMQNSSEWLSLFPDLRSNGGVSYTYPLNDLDPYTNFTYRVIANREDNQKQVVGRPSPPSETVKPDCIGQYTISRITKKPCALTHAHYMLR